MSRLIFIDDVERAKWKCTHLHLRAEEIKKELFFAALQRTRLREKRAKLSKIISLLHPSFYRHRTRKFIFFYFISRYHGNDFLHQ
jgi:hypothetical protein